MKKPDENAALESLLHTLAQERTLDLRGYKRSTLERRIQRRMDKVGAKNYPQYLELVRKQPTELNELLDTILINVTRFFRDPPAWSFLRENVLPQLLVKARTKGTLRVWSAGCASGEEVYSAAILIMEQLEGSPAQDIDIKIYATDEDEDAINFARRGKYPEESLEFVPAELRKKYFGADRRSLIPKLRRMIIFGRSNLLTNPPISHIDLLICRNVLIYFDQLAQEHILSKLTRALDEGGVLFLGKSESQMRKSPNLKPLNSKWRIFQCGGRNDSQEKPGAKDSSVVKKTTEELHLLRAYQQSILEALEPGILIMDSGDQVITENEAARRFWQSSGGMTGKLLQKTELWNMCPDLEARLKESRGARPTTVRFECKSPEGLKLALTIKPILSQGARGQVGTLLYMEDITPGAALQNTIQQLENTTEELQSSNEELESTNEELQSTNEELETINEELQSSNEELETTNEELQSLNEELETTNAELNVRGQQLENLSEQYDAMLNRMPLPVLVVDYHRTIHLFNSAAQKLLGFPKPSAEGMRVDQLPLPAATRRLLAEKHNAALRAGRPELLTNTVLETTNGPKLANIHISPILSKTPEQAVIIILEPIAKSSASEAGIARATLNDLQGNSRGKARSNKSAKASRT